MCRNVDLHMGYMHIVPIFVPMIFQEQFRYQICTSVRLPIGLTLTVMPPVPYREAVQSENFEFSG